MEPGGESVVPIYLAVVRVAQCFFCSKQWELEPQGVPERCKFCGSPDWELGPESRDTRFIRQGIDRSRNVLNPGARSRKRQEQGRRQWQGFKPKPGVDDAENSKTDDGTS